MSFSGFDESESCGLRRLLRALGIKLAPNFSKNTTHLLCPSATGPKFAKACEWGKPVVKMSWLAAIVSTGIISSLEDHLVPGSVAGSKEMLKLDLGVPIEVEVDGKGKAKDITPVDHFPADSFESRAEPPLRFQTTHSLQVNSVVSALSQSGSLPLTPTCPSHIQESVTQSDPGAGNDAPKSSWRELEHERLTAKIPSSRTPSPMKVAKAGSRSSISPTKIDHEATKALQESITRALKRHRSEDDEILNGGRNSKRQRPQRHKVSYTLVMACKFVLINMVLQALSRQASTSKFRAAEVATTPFAVAPTSPFESFDLVESDMLPDIESAVGLKKDASHQMNSSRRTRSSDENVNGLSQEESMRVVYEDPGLADERKKLMEFLKTQTPESPSKASKAPISVRRGKKTRKGMRC